jgi:putative endonuclease
MLGYWVYMLASRRNGTLYVGVTRGRHGPGTPGARDLLRRVAEHREGMVPGFTANYGVTRLVWFETTTRSRPRSGARSASRSGRAHGRWR